MKRLIVYFDFRLNTVMSNLYQSDKIVAVTNAQN